MIDEKEIIDCPDCRNYSYYYIYETYSEKHSFEDLGFIALAEYSGVYAPCERHFITSRKL